MAKAKKRAGVIDEKVLKEVLRMTLMLHYRIQQESERRRAFLLRELRRQFKGYRWESGLGDYFIGTRGNKAKHVTLASIEWNKRGMFKANFTINHEARSAEPLSKGVRLGDRS